MIPAHYREDPDTINFGDEMRWDFNPVPETDPLHTREFQYLVNRMPFWKTLANAYTLTNDERYARAWTEQLLSWMEQTSKPEEDGEDKSLSWRSLEAAIRMNDSWPYAYLSFLNSPNLTPEIHSAFVRSAMEHARYLADVLTGFPRRTGNWVASEALGLLTVSLMFPEWKDSERFRNIAAARLDKEIHHQIHSDGATKELSPWYHNVSLGCFRNALNLSALAGFDLGDSFRSRLRSMYLYNLGMMDPYGNVPMFNDGLPFNALSSLESASKTFDDPSFSYPTETEKISTLEEFSWFPDAGFAVFRSGWKKPGFTLWFDAGPPGIEHWHEDRLGVILSINGHEILTEAGHCAYDSSLWRFYSLGTSAHNTITVDDKWQHAGGTNLPVENLAASTDFFDLAEGIYDRGYQEAFHIDRPYWPLAYRGEKDESVSHSRTVVFIKPSFFLIWDRLQGKGTHDYTSYFHLDSPTATVDPETLTVHAKNPKEGGLRIVPLEVAGLKIRTAHGQTEPVLGWKLFPRYPITTVIYGKTKEAPTFFATLLVPSTGKAAALETNQIAPLGWEVIIGEEKTHLFLAAPDKENECFQSDFSPGFEAEAVLALFQKAESPEKTQIGLHKARILRFGCTEYTLNPPATLQIIRNIESDHVSYSLQNGLDQNIKITGPDPGSSTNLDPGASWEIRVTNSANH